MFFFGVCRESCSHDDIDYCNYLVVVKMNGVTITISRTYKIDAPGITGHAIYFTIVGDKPEAFFINSKEMESFQWVIALMSS